MVTINDRRIGYKQYDEKNRISKNESDNELLIKMEKQLCAYNIPMMFENIFKIIHILRKDKMTNRNWFTANCILNYTTTENLLSG